MNIDELNVMTDDELRMKVAELLGWTNIRIIGLNKIPKGTPPEHKETDVWVIPCYPKYIAMAWELVDIMQTIPEGGGPRWEIEISSDVGDWCCTVAYEAWIGEVYEVHADSAARAITIAFILAIGDDSDE